MATGFQVTMKLEVKELLDALKDQRKRAKKALRTGVVKAGRVVTRAVKNRLKNIRETKLLWRSIGNVVKTYPSGAVVSITGVRKGFRQSVKIKKGRVYRIIRGRLVRLKKPRPDMLQMIRNPEKYLHLVELGFTQKGGGHVAGKYPIRGGMEDSKKEAEAIIAAEFKAGVEGA